MTDITPLLEQLALKLGTTTEYLWGVMLKQAPIEGFVWVAQFCAMLVGIFGLYRLTKYLAKQDSWDEPHIVVPVIFAWIVMGMFFLFIFLSVSTIVACFLNPEYWALEQILDKLNPSS